MGWSAPTQTAIHAKNKDIHSSFLFLTIAMCCFLRDPIVDADSPTPDIHHYKHSHTRTRTLINRLTLR